MDQPIQHELAKSQVLETLMMRRPTPTTSGAGIIRHQLQRENFARKMRRMALFLPPDIQLAWDLADRKHRKRRAGIRGIRNRRIIAVDGKRELHATKGWRARR